MQFVLQIDDGKGAFVLSKFVYLVNHILLFFFGVLDDGRGVHKQNLSLSLKVPYYTDFHIFIPHSRLQKTL